MRQMTAMVSGADGARVEVYVYELNPGEKLSGVLVGIGPVAEVYPGNPGRRAGWSRKMGGGSSLMPTMLLRRSDGEVVVVVSDKNLRGVLSYECWYDR